MYTLTYAKKAVNEAQKNYDLAKKCGVNFYFHAFSALFYLKNK